MKKPDWINLLDKVRALSPRERTGLACLVLVAVIAATAQTLDWAAEADRAGIDVRLRREQVEADLAEASNTAAQEDIRRAVDKLQSWSIVEAAEGVAQADALAAVEALAEQAGLTNAQVALEPQGDAQASRIRALTVSLRADFDWAAIRSLLRAMDRSRLSLVVESIGRRFNTNQQPMMNLVIRIPFIGGGARS